MVVWLKGRIGGGEKWLDLGLLVDVIEFVDGLDM